MVKTATCSELQQLYAPLVVQCQFSDCTHRHEPGCAVIAAVKKGEVAPERYDSYLRLREEHEALEREAY